MTYELFFEDDGVIEVETPKNFMDVVYKDMKYDGEHIDNEPDKEPIRTISVLSGFNEFCEIRYYKNAIALEYRTKYIVLGGDIRDFDYSLAFRSVDYIDVIATPHYLCSMNEFPMKPQWDSDSEFKLASEYDREPNPEITLFDFAKNSQGGDNEF